MHKAIERQLKPRPKVQGSETNASPGTLPALEHGKSKGQVSVRARGRGLATDVRPG